MNVDLQRGSTVVDIRAVYFEWDRVDKKKKKKMTVGNNPPEMKDMGCIFGFQQSCINFCVPLFEGY